MKYRTTQKAIKNGYDKTIKVSYCALQHLLNYESPEAYTAGSYGWGADIYSFGGVAIVTGYAPFGDITPDYDRVRFYDQQAERILYDRGACYEDIKKRLRGLIADFIGEMTA